MSTPSFTKIMLTHRLNGVKIDNSCRFFCQDMLSTLSFLVNLYSNVIFYHYQLQNYVIFIMDTPLVKNPKTIKMIGKNANLLSEQEIEEHERDDDEPEKPANATS